MESSTSTSIPPLISVSVVVGQHNSIGNSPLSNVAVGLWSWFLWTVSSVLSLHMWHFLGLKQHWVFLDMGSITGGGGCQNFRRTVWLKISTMDFILTSNEYAEHLREDMQLSVRILNVSWWVWQVFGMSYGCS